ncbi:hypothetical protein THRCLA_21441, partial [Thraustotheca clavata]
VFVVFGGALMILMIFMALFLKIMHHYVLKHAKSHFLSHREDFVGSHFHDDELHEALKSAAIIENEGDLAPPVAMEQMRTVSESIQGLENKNRGCFKNILIVQMIRACYRKVYRPRDQVQDNLDLMLKMPLPFSRRLVQFCVRAFLNVNGLFLNMLLNCVVPTLNKTEMAYLGILQVPLLINAFILAPLLHNFSILEATCRADPKAVFDYIREVIDQNDSNTDSYIDIEALRQTLITFGFKLSSHKIPQNKSKGTTCHVEHSIGIV